MPVYFLTLDAGTFHRQMVPALASAWRQRRFAPCRSLCAALVPAARAFRARYHTGGEEPLLSRVAQGDSDLPFDRGLWRFLAGEVLWYGAADIPDLQTAPDTLCCLLAPEHYRQGDVRRQQFAPIQQAHLGSRDLVFGGGFYRPDHAGVNDTADVARLAEYLAGIDPGRWRGADLGALPGLTEDEEREDELAFARECFGALKELYERAWGAGRVIVCEVL